jgi:leukotriene-A4 hydrolase
MANILGSGLRLGFLALVLGAVSVEAAVASDAPYDPTRDYHSYAQPRAMRIEHADLRLDVDFTARRLSGSVDLRVRRVDAAARELALDTRDLTIRAVGLVSGARVEPLEFHLDAPDAVLGSALHVTLPGTADAAFTVRVAYQTGPDASGLQWLTPEQTSGKKHPFLFTQSQAIHARSWIPLQDTPQVRMTYRAQIKVPQGLTAVMSAAQRPADGENAFAFEMNQPIPSYLMALGVGDIAYRDIGARTRVYAEPSVVEAARREFADTESMIAACEKLFGPYRWERYDLLILPPSFPFGGMENPRLSFITPTVIAGDKSLTSLIAHELAHSWSGNLVTNASWRDMWLNEGFTTFLERRIMETLYGARRREMEDVLGLQSLEEDFASLEPRDELLIPDLRGRNPDDVFSEVPYEKGYLFLRFLESKVGRQKFDDFLRGYFAKFSFQSLNTEQFLDYLNAQLLAANPGLVTRAQLDNWLTQPGLPSDAVLPSADVFKRVDAARNEWLAGQRAARDLDTAGWSTHEWLHFVDNLPPRLSPAQVTDLDATFHFTDTGNAQIAHSWLRVAIRNHYEPALPRLEAYLNGIGRRILIKPLYEDLMRTDWGKEFARRVYAKARVGYHPITVATLDPIVLGADKK